MFLSSVTTADFYFESNLLKRRSQANCACTYFRYNALTTNIMNRGKLLHSGMTSLHSFEPAAERFCVWLSDMETTMQTLEVEADKVRQNYGGSGDIPQSELKKFKVGPHMCNF